MGLRDPFTLRPHGAARLLAEGTADGLRGVCGTGPVRANPRRTEAS
jgi:hypothetical protein